MHDRRGGDFWLLVPGIACFGGYLEKLYRFGGYFDGLSGGGCAVWEQEHEARGAAECDGGYSGKIQRKTGIARSGICYTLMITEYGMTALRIKRYKAIR